MNEKPLKSALLLNAIFSTLSGLTFIIFSQAITNLIGIGTPIIYQIIGIGLLGFASDLVWTATRTPINTFHALLISIADLLWVLGTGLLILLTFNSLNGIGILAMLIVATIVLLLGLRQFKSISQVYALPNKTNTHKLCVAIDTPQPADKMWPLIADLAHIKAYSPHLTAVILRNNAQPGVNAIRQCTDNKGNTWAEHCTRYDHQTHTLNMTFLADEPNFPYPFKTMTGGWQVQPHGNGSTVNIWFEVTPKYPLAHPLILAVMTKDLARNFGDLVARMAATASGQTIAPEATPPQHNISYKLIPCHS